MVQIGKWIVTVRRVYALNVPASSYRLGKTLGRYFPDIVNVVDNIQSFGPI